jgi:ABC-2 type transport system permease protein
LLSVRSREVKLRALDASLVESQRLKWQLVNLVVPVLLVLIFAIAYGYWRRKRYTGI